MRATVGASTLSFQDSNIAAGTAYTYHVVAVDAVGDSAASAQAQATPQNASDNTRFYVGIAIAVVAVTSSLSW